MAGSPRVPSVMSPFAAPMLRALAPLVVAWTGTAAAADDPRLHAIGGRWHIEQAVPFKDDYDDPRAPCELIAGGSFTGGFQDWLLLPFSEHDGDAWAATDADIVSGASLLVPMDGQVARLTAHVAATGPDGEAVVDPASAVAEISLVATRIVSRPQLTLVLLGGWEVVVFGDAQYEFIVRVDVVSSNGIVASHLVSDLPSPVGLPCGHGLAAFGVIGHRDPIVTLDLLGTPGQPAGLALGDEVDIRVTLELHAAAAGPCDLAELVAALYVDEFQFCGEGPSADLDGSGLVDGIDLALLLGAWGSCRRLDAACPADLDLDAAVGGGDLGLLLGAWSQPGDLPVTEG
jgi:hypothetical protein